MHSISGMDLHLDTQVSHSGVMYMICVVNPWRMREGYGSCSVCVSVCYHASCYIPRLRVQTAVLQGSLWRSERMICVDFAENVLFSSFSVIC